MMAMPLPARYRPTVTRASAMAALLVGLWTLSISLPLPGVGIAPNEEDEQAAEDDCCDPPCEDADEDGTCPDGCAHCSCCPGVAPALAASSSPPAAVAPRPVEVRPVDVARVPEDRPRARVFHPPRSSRS
jgi:hypothetical protein